MSFDNRADSDNVHFPTKALHRRTGKIRFGRITDSINFGGTPRHGVCRFSLPRQFRLSAADVPAAFSGRSLAVAAAGGNGVPQSGAASPPPIGAAEPIGSAGFAPVDFPLADCGILAICFLREAVL